MWGKAVPEAAADSRSRSQFKLATSSMRKPSAGAHGWSHTISKCFSILPFADSGWQSPRLTWAGHRRMRVDATDGKLHSRSCTSET